ncbi:ATP-grasp domain-containing protein [Thermoanaerobacterium sp. R66]|uniref:ATP-grasp domain-containing protein n=1 Tax=Thermoanaerobacterium sp. R66 TaxID=2742479 RepID=UPI002380731B|nr:ATP-grasp domain-containing protein [Thermoanaerobacterium sp. R66]MDE4542537.1 ATP-grasp domain-containing protein [Thermoanaerobacterium sp. R66]
MKKRVLVYPCGTEIGLEIYRSVKNSIHFELIGGSSTYDHGRFVYKNHIDNLPFITDDSKLEEIIKFNELIKKYNIDFIYPAMDGVLYKFAEYRDYLDCTLIAPKFETAIITRSKSKTYNLLKDYIEVPKIYDFNDPHLVYPLFVKPDVGQGSKYTRLLRSPKDLEFYIQGNETKGMLLLEYLPGPEYTVDCFTNNEGKLIYVGGRGRKRIRDGISVNTIEEKNDELKKIAEIINSKIQQKGGWFFQVKKNLNGDFSLLEVASRIAGTSSFTRNLGVNLPLLTLHLFNGNDIDSVIVNNYNLELDRALYNKFNNDIKYSRVYIDYDDTLMVNGKVNTQIIAFLYQCVNEDIPITLITKYEGDLEEELKKHKLVSLFDDIIHIRTDDEKYKHIKEKDSIFIDDSYGERLKVKSKLGINVFDGHMIECLLKDIE